jgi:hypothetical protein
LYLLCLIYYSVYRYLYPYVVCMYVCTLLLLACDVWDIWFNQVRAQRGPASGGSGAWGVPIYHIYGAPWLKYFTGLRLCSVQWSAVLLCKTVKFCSISLKYRLNISYIHHVVSWCVVPCASFAGAGDFISDKCYSTGTSTTGESTVLAAASTIEDSG